MNAISVTNPPPQCIDIPATLLRDARAAAMHGNGKTMDLLAEKLALPAHEFVARLGHTLHYPVANIHDLHHWHIAFDILPFTLATQQECLLFRNAKDQLLLVFSDPFAEDLQNWATAYIAQPFLWQLAAHADIMAYLSHHEASIHAMDHTSNGAEHANTPTAGIAVLSLKSISEDTSPIIKLVHSTLYDALRINASDIHLETTHSGLTIKYRIDGVLSAVASAQGLEQADQVISRIKVMSELDIAERRIPQDGRFKISIQGREIDFRVSIMPSIFGEDAVLRILDKQALADQSKGLRLDYLGLDDTTITQIRRLYNEPYGMILVTGPTGSGKSTTLYAALTEINHGLDKIITIEDPVEYQIAGVLQIPVNEKKGLTFARGLRSILRHDPDIIMVGEIRDSETAKIAVQAALTGHLVFTTVHANSSLDVIGRFLHMEVDPYSFVSALNGILAQRLIRINCPHCITPSMPDIKLLADSGLTAETVMHYQFRSGLGCGQCRGTGFKGRKAITELLHLNDEIRELIIAREPIRQIKEAARKNGTRFLRESALALVAQGETTLQEANRVTFTA